MFMNGHGGRGGDSTNHGTDNANNFKSVPPSSRVDDPQNLRKDDHASDDSDS